MKKSKQTTPEVLKNIDESLETIAESVQLIAASRKQIERLDQIVIDNLIIVGNIMKSMKLEGAEVDE